MLVPGISFDWSARGFCAGDVRLITSSSLKAEESAFTGESMAVEKDAGGAECSAGDR